MFFPVALPLLGIKFEKFPKPNRMKKIIKKKKLDLLRQIPNVIHPKVLKEKFPMDNNYFLSAEYNLILTILKDLLQKSNFITPKREKSLKG